MKYVLLIVFSVLNLSVFGATTTAPMTKPTSTPTEGAAAGDNTQINQRDKKQNEVTAGQHAHDDRRPQARRSVDDRGIVPTPETEQPN